jgi:drug/metabolite transporter (DMT)-like permease
MSDASIQRPLRGIALKLGSVICFIVMASLIKATSAHVPAGEAVFFRSFFAIPVIVVWLAYRRELATGFRAVPRLWVWALRAWVICPCPR